MHRLQLIQTSVMGLDGSMTATAAPDVQRRGLPRIDVALHSAKISVLRRENRSLPGKRDFDLLAWLTEAAA